jgi:hypothetical protein
MPAYGIHDPRIAQGFGALATAMFPDATKVVHASLMAAQRENAYAQAYLHDTQADQISQQIESVIQARSAIQHGDFSTDGGRRDLASSMVGMKDGLQYGPKAATGFAEFTQPGSLGPNLSEIMAATGAQQFDHTPEGLDQRLATTRYGYDQAYQRAVDSTGVRMDQSNTNNVRNNETKIGMNDADNVAAGERNDATNATRERIGAAKGAGAKLKTVGPAALKQFGAAISARLAAAHDGAGVDPETLQQLVTAAADGYQQHGNAAKAVEDAVMGADVDVEDGWFSSPQVKLRTPIAAPGAPAAPLPAPAAPAEAAPAPGPAASFSEGQTAKNPKTGQRIVFRGGKWEPI